MWNPLKLSGHYLLCLFATLSLLSLNGVEKIAAATVEGESRDQVGMSMFKKWLKPDTPSGATLMTLPKDHWALAMSLKVNPLRSLHFCTGTI